MIGPSLLVQHFIGLTLFTLYVEERMRMATTENSSKNIEISKAPMLNTAGSKSLIVFTVLALACLAGFSSRLFAVIRFESIIHEFDPW